MKKKVALIFGITGQDGAYLSKFLLSKNYIVHGIKRKSSSINTSRIDDIYIDPHDGGSFFLHYGDLSDSLSVLKNIEKIKPDEIYNLAAQSHVKVSFETPEYTANADGLGVLRILETMRRIKNKRIKFYQASTSEMFGKILEPIQNETTPFYPRSPYGVSKLYSHWMTINYRESFGLRACSGILFNHESPLRGPEFVTKKITTQLCEIKFGSREKLTLGNLNAKRDWGYAKEYVEAMWLMLQQDHLEDYVIATGKTTSVKEFISFCCAELEIDLAWEGEGEFEKGFDKKTNKLIIEVSKDYYRPAEVDILIGSSEKAKKQLGWEAKTDVKSLASIMVSFDRKRLA